MNFGDIKNIHFVGIGGIGMSGLAEVLAAGGASVSGCDAKSSSVTDLLSSRGIRVAIGHDASHVDDAGLLVITSAVRGEHPELEAARVKGVRVMKRAEVLGAIVNAKRSIGVAGTHGKTTTSAMVSTILEEAGLDPTVLVGGMVRNFQTNAKSGKSDFLVVEADEYDRTFHQLRPELAVVTNIEADHLEYYGSLEAIREAFTIFLKGVKGTIVACVDDAEVANVVREFPKVVGYGLGEHAQLRATNVTFNERGSSFDVPGVGFFKLFVPGEHNVRNALGAIGVALALHIDAHVISMALAKFLGVDRRFQILGDYQGAIVVDDYAHHPTEIRATLQAARSGYPRRRLVALFQPHLYSRTADFAREFGEALKEADVPIVSPIYAAREAPVNGMSSKIIADAVPGIEFLDRSNAQIVNELRRRLAPQDIFIAMGAGDVHEIAEQLVRGEEA
ncbi:MAG TPA: UDP-N-acetylmuramate--L-alanine ligase [Thermoanaerobaculia bacterium]|nr:UDP-N-acetylmuramate--L-alanine ligase [Thermoanaerobaculia bacterium]